MAAQDLEHIGAIVARVLDAHGLRDLLPPDADPKTSGPRNNNWRGGRRVDSHGYVQIYAPGHPRASTTHYVFEHLLVAEVALGRPLPLTAPVHHVNGDRTDNRPANLVICEDNEYHHLLHKRQRAMEACGDPSAQRCAHCYGYDRQGEMYHSAQQSYHRSCAAEYARERRRRRAAASRTA